MTGNGRRSSPPGAAAPGSLSLHRFAGTPTEVGRQHGEACRDLVAAHLDTVLDRLGLVGVEHEVIATAVNRFRPWVQRHAPHFDEEIVGLSEGADISLEHAYLLQLRAEVNADLRRRSRPDDNECTTFCAHRDATSSGVGLIGQNIDLPAFYQDLLIVMNVQPTSGPEVLMLTPAGQISYIGISGEGMGVVANFLHCDGWRPGFPRYLFSRYLMAEDSVEDAVTALTRLPRASSRNLMVMDRHGELVGLENTPSDVAVLRPVDGILTHANHYLSPQFLLEERSTPAGLHNSRTRQQRIDTLMKEQAGALCPRTVAAIMRDRSDAPHALSHTLQDCGPTAGSPPADDSITVGSLLAEPSAGRIWACAGPPSESLYHQYSIDGRLLADETL
ncbi:C45 family peptidase [Micromonospora sp. B11E3]|uniref:C45 family peptidase n=1 Tax=Micromonospora sp. B11E3 TaxID=3153562 RepID=UPI00325F7A61